MEPKLRPDGSFCVEVALRIEADAPDHLGARLALWFENWTATNQEWTWESGRRLRYVDDFSGAPHFVECAAGVLRFHLEGKPGAKWWKDWLILRLLKDLQEAFVEVKAVDKIHDCPGQ
jgi:hypothetical protein